MELPKSSIRFDDDATTAGCYYFKVLEATGLSLMLYSGTAKSVLDLNFAEILPWFSFWRIEKEAVASVRRLGTFS